MSEVVDYLVWRCRAGNGPCVADRYRAWSYRDFAERVDAAAAQLAAAGAERHSTIAIRMPNRLELMVVLMAVWRLGAVAAPVDPGACRARAERQ